MKRVLSLVHGGYSTHTVRVVAISKALRDTGKYDILFSGTGPYMKIVEDAGFDWVSTKTVTHDEIFRPLKSKLPTVIFNQKNMEELFKAEDALMREHKPDIIIRELFRELAGIAAKQDNVRAYDIYLQQGNLSPFYRLDFVPDAISTVFPFLKEKYLRPILPFAERYGRRTNSRHLRKKMKALGLEEFLRIDGVAPDLTLFPDLPEFMPLSGFDQEVCKYLGPIIVEQHQSGPSWLDNYCNDPRPKVLITAGTTGEHDNVDLMHRAFSDERYAVAIYTNQGDVPSTFYSGRPFDITAVLPHADVFVTHGGQGSSYMGILYKVPMLSLHGHFEQQCFSKEIVRNRIGLTIHKGKRNQYAIRSAVDELIANKVYKKNIAHLSTYMGKYNAMELTVKYIDEGYAKFRSQSTGCSSNRVKPDACTRPS